MHRSPAFAELLKRYREAAGLTQEGLAGRAYLSARTVSNLERGVNRAPYPDTLRRLADALGLSEDDRAELRASARGPEAGPVPDASNGRRAEVEGGFLGALPAGRLVSRRGELGRILGALEAAAEGHGRLVLLAGEPGVGKTRLAQEVSSRAWEGGSLVAAGRCYEAQGGVPFYPFLDALSALYEGAPQEAREGASGRWPYLTRLLPDQFPSRAAAPAESPEEQQLLLRAVTGFVREVSASTPVALMLDDLHWADGASLDLLAHLARHTRADRVLVLGTYRDVEVGRGHPLRKVVRDLDREGLVERVGVRRLDREETAALMADRLEGAEVSEEFIGLVYDHTAGNPFFTFEVVKALIERGDLLRWEGRWIRKEIQRIEVPQNVREAIAERVSRLGARTQEVLEEASVLGQVFGFEELRAVSDRDEEEVEEALEEAEAAGLVRTATGHYAFNHALTQQTLYAELPRAGRRRLHRAAGEGLERLTASGRRRAAEISRHFVEGRAPARALPYALLAGDEAEAVFAHSDAERHYRGALELAAEVGDGAAKGRALRRIGGVLTVTGRYDEALEALDEAMELTVQAHDREEEARVAARTGLVHYYKGGARSEFIARLSTLAQGLDPPASSGISPGSLAALWRTLAALFFAARRYDESLEAARRTLSLAREAGDDYTVVRAGMACANALVFLRRPQEARRELEATIPLGERTGATLNLLFGTLILDLLDTARGEFGRGLGWARRGLELAEQLGNRHEITLRLARVGLILFHLGEWEEARGYLERGTEVARSVGPLLLSAWAPGYLGKLRMAEGAWDEAARHLEEAAGLAGSIRWPTPLRYVEALRAELDLLEGRPGAALARLEPLADAPDLDWLCATVLLTVLAWTHLELGDAARAEAVADRAIAEAATMNNRVDMVEALRVKGMVLARQERREESAAVLEEALSMARSMPVPYAEARVLHEYGVLNACRGEPEQARELLFAALETFAGLKAAKDAERTGRQLGGLGPTRLDTT